MYYVSVVLAALLPGVSYGLTHGCLKLDSLTMDKMLAADGHSFFVKIDEPYSYGEKANAFRTICHLAYAVPNFFAAEVPVQRFNQKENDDVRERLNLTLAEFPAFYFFTDANTEGTRYTDAIQAANMIKWLRLRGVTLPSVDTIDELDEIVDEFLIDFNIRHVERAKQLVPKYETDAKAPMYVKIMEKFLAHGPGYAADEIARVMKILEGKVHPQKRAELGDKLKVLKVFGKVEACDVFQCPDGYQKRFGASGIIGSDVETCCKPPCLDMEGDEHDAQGHHCDYYDERTALECGDWDTGSFRANKMCCACGGGQVRMPEGRD
mmetsp:Transcript_68020/g.160116  ORF Transcript_68020/g.160116 Transcript_68020/m.160116 type:complete len:322 (+) Transcript_68020:98-1063(+)